MSKKTLRVAATGLSLLALLGIGYLFGRSDSMTADAIAASPVEALAERDVYYPGSEDIGPDEMRIVALGTGMPSPRPKQAAACLRRGIGIPEPHVMTRISSGFNASVPG